MSVERWLHTPVSVSTSTPDDRRMRFAVRDFDPAYQEAVESLVNANLRERFGVLKPELNPDLPLI